MFLFWQNYLPHPIAFSFGTVSIHWYGLILVIAILIGLWSADKLLSKTLSKGQIEDLFFYLIIASLIGARFGHVVFFNLAYYLQHPENILKIWHGGMSIQGALLFGFLTLILWARKWQVKVFTLADALVPAVALGQAIGRWGNYFNQELFGRPTDSFIGIPINSVYRVPGFEGYNFFQPTFFYESILNLILFLVLHKLTKYQLKTGFLTLIYLLGYSLIRFFMEFIRIDPTILLFNIRLPQLISLVVVLLTLFFIFKYYLKPLPKVEK